MISSPCKDCPRLNSPKDECVDYCEKIKALQSYIVSQGNSLRTASDYTELDSLQIPMVLFVRDLLEPRIEAIRVEEAFHDPTGHNGYSVQYF